MRRKLAAGALASGVGAGALYLGLARLPVTRVADHPYFTASTPRVIAHRGGRGLWPENTLHAFEKAARLGVDAVEMDVRSTADGILVALHDRTVDRTTDGRGAVGDKKLSELEALDAGYRWSDGNGNYPYRGRGVRIPTLEEVFRALPGVRLNLELREPSPSLAVSLCQLVRRAGMQDKILVASFHRRAVEAFRSRCPEVATAATPAEVRAFLAASLLFLPALHRPAAQALQVPERFRGFPVLSATFVEQAHRRNLRVHVWTVNEPGEMKRFLDLGLDGILTDYPDRLLSLLGRSARP
jgi:glycerophosphoryl diester phosphodiesterase